MQGLACANDPDRYAIAIIKRDGIDFRDKKIVPE